MKIINKKDLLLTGMFILISFALFLSWSTTKAGLGFPLDDAWIHQTYGRNLGEIYQWSFLVDTPSGGSTGPAWGFLIGLIYLLKIPPIAGTLFIGFLFLWGSSLLAISIFEKFGFPKGLVCTCAGLLIALEWHLIWAAMSGMETIVLIFIILLFFYWIFSKKENWWLPGMLIGISIWIRPDGITLFGPALVILFVRQYSKQAILRSLFSLLGSFSVLFALYFLFNWVVAGDIWPNTFYAKQAEYALLRETGLGYRYLLVSLQLLTGAGAVLLPGVFIEIKESIQRNEWERIIALIWVLGFIGLYAWRLPVTYQHGRYIMPAMPLGFILGLSGMMRWIDLRARFFWRRIISGVWAGSIVIVTLMFLIQGAQAYAADVAVIETEMVDTALWIKHNTANDAVIAAHDIGALGYFSDRDILDMAGLITPDVIPFIRNQAALGEYLNQKNVQYLMTFPDWYPKLVNGLELAYMSKGNYAPKLGSTNMALYYWK